ncbi:MAG: hypothetical protein HQM16_18650 [Deltaproteobacteria bacterium]|nr:hypothetical protein [Deltaproteobacteria bacterium]
MTHFGDSQAILSTGLTQHFHPQWTVISMIPVVIIQRYWMKRQQRATDAKQNRDFMRARFVVILWMFVAALTGVAAQMEFLPLFFHQFVSWPFVVFFMWDLVKMLKKNHPA